MKAEQRRGSSSFLEMQAQSKCNSCEQVSFVANIADERLAVRAALLYPKREPRERLKRAKLRHNTDVWTRTVASSIASQPPSAHRAVLYPANGSKMVSTPYSAFIRCCTTAVNEDSHTEMYASSERVSYKTFDNQRTKNAGDDLAQMMAKQREVTTMNTKYDDSSAESCDPQLQVCANIRNGKASIYPLSEPLEYLKIQLLNIFKCVPCDPDELTIKLKSTHCCQNWVSIPII